MQVEELRLDGNAAGGALRDVFAFDVTAARVTCAGCGDEQPIGAMHAYGHPLGLVLRCPACDASVLRLVQTPRQLRLDVSGIRLLIMPEGSLPT
jgi:hypothetical protein